jgi:hypothetical protein
LLPRYHHQANTYIFALPVHQLLSRDDIEFISTEIRRLRGTR